MFSALIYNNFKVIEFKSFTSNTKLGMTLADLSDYEEIKLRNPWTRYSLKLSSYDLLRVLDIAILTYWFFCHFKF